MLITVSTSILSVILFIIGNYQFRSAFVRMFKELLFCSRPTKYSNNAPGTTGSNTAGKRSHVIPAPPLIQRPGTKEEKEANLKSCDQCEEPPT